MADVNEDAQVTADTTAAPHATPVSLPGVTTSAIEAPELPINANPSALEAGSSSDEVSWFPNGYFHLPNSSQHSIRDDDSALGESLVFAHHCRHRDGVIADSIGIPRYL